MHLFDRRMLLLHDSFAVASRLPPRAVASRMQMRLSTDTGRLIRLDGTISETGFEFHGSVVWVSPGVIVRGTLAPRAGGTEVRVVIRPHFLTIAAYLVIGAVFVTVVIDHIGYAALLYGMMLLGFLAGALPAKKRLRELIDVAP